MVAVCRLNQLTVLLKHRSEDGYKLMRPFTMKTILHWETAQHSAAPFWTFAVMFMKSGTTVFNMISLGQAAAEKTLLDRVVFAMPISSTPGLPQTLLSVSLNSLLVWSI